MKVMLLLHFFEAEKFLGQTLVPVEVEDWDQLAHSVGDVYPAKNLRIAVGDKELVQVPLPSLKQGYGPDTNVRVMQIILL